jgi:hypothetical protein
MSTEAIVHLASGLTESDVARLRELMLEFHRAGRTADGEVLARVHALIESVSFPAEVDDAEHDEAFAREFEQGERDLAEGQTISHEEMLRQLGTLEHVRD